MLKGFVFALLLPIIGGIAFSFVCFQGLDFETGFMALLGAALWYASFNSFYQETPINKSGIIWSVLFFAGGIGGSVLVQYLIRLKSVVG
jgi:Na+/H+ antiporter NhaD/arsenite permease-like protein